MKKINFQAFTLVELIVVITIVGILSTIGFVSYSGYLSGARDSNRVSQMVKLSDSLQVYSTKKSLPLPDDSVEITASGTSNLVAYQGKVGVDVLETIDYTNGGTDPKNDSYYSYYLTRDRNSMQLMALMEEQQSVGFTANTYALDYSDRYPKVFGRKLGIMTDTSNVPIEQLSLTTLDIVDENVNSYISYISNDEVVEGTGTQLRNIIPNGSCKRIKQTGGASGNGEYTINPGGTGDVGVYCDMEVAGGGWTMVSSSEDGATLSIPTGLVYSQSMIYAPNTGKSEIVTSTTATNTVGSYTLGSGGISGGVSGDGLNGEVGMVLVK